MCFLGAIEQEEEGLNPQPQAYGPLKMQEARINTLTDIGSERTDLAQETETVQQHTVRDIFTS